MTRQVINVGATANDGTGDGLRTAYIKCNDNFQELYNTTQTPIQIVNGTSSMAVANSANVTISIAGSSNIVNFAGTVTEFTGNIDVSTDLNVGNSLTITQDVTIGDQLIITGTLGSNLIPDGNGTRILGSSGARWSEINSVTINASSTIDATGNITSTANISAANIIASQDVIIAGSHVTTGNVNAGNVITGGIVDATGNITSGGNISGGNLIIGGLTASADVIATGNIQGQYVIGDGGYLANVTAASNVAVTQIANGTSIVGISSSGGNVEITSGGVLVMETDGATVQYNVPITFGSANIVTTGNVSATNFLGDGSQLTGIDAIQNGTSNVTVASNANTTVGVAGTTILTVSATGSAVTGTISATGDVSGATITGDGSALTALNGTQITTGTVAAARVATLNQNTTGTSGGFSSATTVALTGDVTGNATFTNAGDTASITTTIAANSVALGTDTTGSYVAQGATSGTGLSGSVNTETGTFTVTSNATDANTASTIVARDGSGNFSAGTITATLTGTATSVTSQANSATITAASTNTANQIVLRDGSGDFSAGAITATGAGITALNASNLASGTVPSARLTGTYAITAANVTSQSNSATIAAASINTFSTIVLRDASGNFSAGAITAGGILNGNANGVGNIGSSTGYFNTVFAKATSAEYADIAEIYASDADYAPGTVLIFGGSAEVTISNEDASPRVAGVVSTNPAHLMNSNADGVAVALTGRVPTHVVGQVRKGDMMVATKDGQARAEASPAMGTVIGKALEDFDGTHGTIEVVVGRL
jgi:hypothetical protein